jgi:HEPN domain-containing protein
MMLSHEHAAMLLRKAADDLIAADAVLQLGIALDTVGFHAQQAVEKSLKAILSFNGFEYPRTHDLAQLLTLVLDIDPHLVSLQGDVLPLTRFSMGIRYSDEDKLLEQEAFEAFDAAARVYRFTVGYLGIGYENPEDWYYSSQQ